MSHNRKLLIALIKSWAQAHDHNFVINDPAPDDDGVINTAINLSWLVKEQDKKIDLLFLVDTLEMFLVRLERNKKRGAAGLSCKKCHVYYEFADSNQDDGTLICYSCRKPCG